MYTKDYFKNKKITVMGLGTQGRQLYDTEFLAKEGANIIVSDTKDADQLASSIEYLAKYKNVEIRCGGHSEEEFKNRDFILRSAGIHETNPFLSIARDNSIPVYMSADLFSRLVDIPIIGITGSKGKTMTTMFIYEVMKNHFGESNVLLGGNIADTGTLSLLERVSDDSIALFELDSWQLQGFRNIGKSPKYAVFTNFFDDHMDYYKGDMSKYFKDKASIFECQDKSDVLIVSDGAMSAIKHYKGEIRSKVTQVSKIDDSVARLTPLIGHINQLNLSLGVALAREIGVAEGAIEKTLESFVGVKHRLFYMGDVGGVKVYDDSSSSHPCATINAISTVGYNGVMLLVGGADKNSDLTSLREELAKMHDSEIVCVDGTGSDILLQGADFQYTSVPTVAKGLQYIFDNLGDKRTVLVSPAFASFSAEFMNVSQREALVYDYLKKVVK